MTYFTVTIKRHEEKTVPHQVWQKVADSGNERDKGAIYDYAKTERLETSTIDVFEARREELDIDNVICAVLGIVPR